MALRYFGKICRDALENKTPSGLNRMPKKFTENFEPKTFHLICKLVHALIYVEVRDGKSKKVVALSWTSQDAI